MALVPIKQRIRFIAVNLFGTTKIDMKQKTKKCYCVTGYHYDIFECIKVFLSEEKANKFKDTLEANPYKGFSVLDNKVFIYKKQKYLGFTIEIVDFDSGE